MKLKSSKSLLKRVRITKKKKLLRRLVGQNHFNAKDPGSKTRAKRRGKKVSEVERNLIRKLLPYHY